MKTDWPPETVLSVARAAGLEFKKVGSHEYAVRCPRYGLHRNDDASPSCRLNDEKGVFHCPVCGCGGGIRAFADLVGVDLAEILRGPHPLDSGRHSTPHEKSKVITVQDLARDKELPTNFLLELGLRDQSKGVLIPYRMSDGAPAPRQRIRTNVSAKMGSLWQSGEGSLVAYGLWRLREAQQMHYLVIVEGESDCWTAWFHGFPALGLPGASTYALIQAEYLRGLDHVYLFQEPDRGGINLVSGLVKRLRNIEWSGRASLITSPPGVKDLNELHKQNPEGFKAAFQDLIRSARPQEIRNGSHEPVLICMADIEPVPVTWLWHPYVPLGKLTIEEGNPGVGKTQVAIAIAAAISRGLPLPSPDGLQDQPRGPACVIYMTAEDGLADTIRPRLDAAGADVSKVHILQAKEVRDPNGVAVRRGMTLADFPVFEKALSLLRPLLLVVDPLQAYLGSGVDMHRSNETRPILADLARLAEEYSCAILLIRHLTKDEKTNPLYRGMGSIDFAAAARSVLLAGQDPRNSDRRALIQIKSSLSTMGPSLGFELLDNRLVWTGKSDLTAAAAMAFQNTPEQLSVVDEAAAFLRLTLADGPRPSEEVLKEARKVGISDATLRRAKFVVGVRSCRRGKPGAARGQGGWECYLTTGPGPSGPQVPPDDHLEDPPEPLGRKGHSHDDQDDHLSTLNDRSNLAEPEEVTVAVQDDHREPLVAEVGDTGDDDSELF